MLHCESGADSIGIARTVGVVALCVNEPDARRIAFVGVRDIGSNAKGFGDRLGDKEGLLVELARCVADANRLFSSPGGDDGKPVCALGVLAINPRHIHRFFEADVHRTVGQAIKAREHGPEDSELGLREGDVETRAARLRHRREHVLRNALRGGESRTSTTSQSGRRTHDR